MSQIKFRLLNENNEIVGYERWYVGAFNMEHKKDYYIAQPCWMYSKDDKYWNPEKIEHRYKDQFTELHDKNGKEIYEGDLLINRGDKDAIFECFYHDGNARFSIARSHYRNSRCGGYIPDITSPYLEIIGNIHKNTELLEIK